MPPHNAISDIFITFDVVNISLYSFHVNSNVRKKSHIRPALLPEIFTFFLCGIVEQHAGQQTETDAGRQAPDHLAAHLPNGHADGDAEQHVNGYLAGKRAFQHKARPFLARCPVRRKAALLENTL